MHRQYTSLDMPSMRAINAREKKWTGASMFAGCGGASTGLKMSGIDVLYVNEFIPGALRTYKANRTPHTVCDPRDVRTVTGKDILRRIGLAKGEMDWFDGSPPCFPAGELIMTSRGPVPIEGIKVGDHVLSHLGKWRYVTDVMSRHYEGELVVLQVYGKPRVRSTPEHPYLTCESVGDMKWDWINSPAPLSMNETWTDAADVDLTRHMGYYPDGEYRLLHALSALPAGLSVDNTTLSGLWCKFSRKEHEAFSGTVYNISVDVDESYTVNGMAVHNCKMYSSAARHNRVGKKANTKVLYSEGVWQQVDDLFDNHIRILREIMPRISCMENVTGMAQSSSIGAFHDVCAAVKDAGYVLEVREIKPALLGVPQTRNRLVFLGIREDLYKRGLRHAWPKPYLSPPVTVRDVVPQARWISKGKGEWKDARNPSPTLTVAAGRGDEFSGLSAAPFYKDQHGVSRQYTIPELKRLFGFPQDFVLGGNYVARYERLARAHSPLAVYNIAMAQLAELERFDNQ